MRQYPGVRAAATTLREVHSTNRHTWSAVAWIEGKTVTISGSGNVAQYAAQKCLHLGAKPVTLSDSNGAIYDPATINAGGERRLRRAIVCSRLEQFRLVEIAPQRIDSNENGRIDPDDQIVMPLRTVQRRVNGATVLKPTC